MKVSYDLHIHTVLSSCSDDSMTPNNIFNMAMLKELDMISICDHNSAKQYEAVEQLKDSYDYLVIYGVEVEVKEGFHVLCYFESFDDIKAFDKELEDNMDKTLEPFGKQIICDEYDEEVDLVSYDLHQSIKLDFKMLIDVARKYKGLVIPAHINRGKKGILSVYSDFSKFDIDGIEIYGRENETKLEQEYPYIKKYKHLFNSDSHSIADINERINFIELTSLDFNGFKDYLRFNNE